MSENLDLVRSICTAWERGEFRSTAWMHPDIEIVWAQPISPGPTKGVGEGAERFRDFLGTLEAVSFATEEIRVIDHERVLVLGHYRGRGKASGLDIGKISREAALFHVEGGKVTRLVTYWNRDRPRRPRPRGVGVSQESVEVVPAVWRPGSADGRPRPRRPRPGGVGSSNRVAGGLNRTTPAGRVGRARARRQSPPRCRGLAVGSPGRQPCSEATTVEETGKKVPPP